jgi:Transposase IS4
MKFYLFFTVRLTEAELQDIANNVNLNESDLDEDLLLGSDDDVEEFLPATQYVGMIGANQDTIPNDDLVSNNSTSSDEDVPLINYLPKNKKRKWKRTSFETKIENWEEPIHASILPEAIPEPIQYFTKYLDDSFFESVAMHTNMMEVKKTGKSLDTNAEEIKHFFAACMLIGIYNLPRIRMFWRLDTRVPIVSDNISRNRFFLLRTRLKLVDDDAVEGKENDRYWKIRPMINQVQKTCLENGRTFSKCSACKVYLCCSVARNCFSDFHS